MKTGYYKAQYGLEWPKTNLEGSRKSSQGHLHQINDSIWQDINTHFNTSYYEYDLYNCVFSKCIYFKYTISVIGRRVGGGGAQGKGAGSIDRFGGVRLPPPPTDLRHVNYIQSLDIIDILRLLTKPWSSVCILRL